MKEIVYRRRTMEMARSFINSIVNQCRGCLRRNELNCSSCFAGTAKIIMKEMSNDENETPIDYSLFARMKKITDIVASANRPILSREIDLEGTCSFQLKLWTLKHMVKIGILGRKVACKKNDRRNYFYFMKSGNKNKETKNENHTTRDR